MLACIALLQYCILQAVIIEHCFTVYEHNVINITLFRIHRMSGT